MGRSFARNVPLHPRPTSARGTLCFSAPNINELAELRSQIATLESSSRIFRHPPYLFTENGVAMLTSVLQSKQALQVNIAIMRTFTKLRSFLSLGSTVSEEVGRLRTETGQLFKVVFEKLDDIEREVTPKLPRNRKKIGLNRDKSN
jgi:hypothetical protein